jgi:antibiotic biosynthesis monooxygenase (ABM) superfamily enzyme
MGAHIGNRRWRAPRLVGLGNAQMNTAGVYAAMMLMTLIGVGSFVSLLVIEYFAPPWRHRTTSPWRGSRPESATVSGNRRLD